MAGAALLSAFTYVPILASDLGRTRCDFLEFGQGCVFQRVTGYRAGRGGLRARAGYNDTDACTYQAEQEPAQTIRRMSFMAAD